MLCGLSRALQFARFFGVRFQQSMKSSTCWEFARRHETRVAAIRWDQKLDLSDLHATSFHV